MRPSLFLILLGIVLTRDDFIVLAHRALRQALGACDLSHKEASALVGIRDAAQWSRTVRGIAQRLAVLAALAQARPEFGARLLEFVAPVLAYGDRRQQKVLTVAGEGRECVVSSRGESSVA
jgi:hypothetical protein